MKFQLKGIDHIQLACPKASEDAARKFYHELLGMKEVAKPDNLQSRGGCWFICGLQEVHLGVEETFSPAKKAHPCFVVHNLNELKAQLLQHQCIVKEDTPIIGRSRFFTEDPFGNRIEFMEYHN